MSWHLLTKDGPWRQLSSHQTTTKRNATNRPQTVKATLRNQTPSTSKFSKKHLRVQKQKVHATIWRYVALATAVGQLKTLQVTSTQVTQVSQTRFWISLSISRCATLPPPRPIRFETRKTRRRGVEIITHFSTGTTTLKAACSSLSVY